MAFLKGFQKITRATQMHTHVVLADFGFHFRFNSVFYFELFGFALPVVLLASFCGQKSYISVISFRPNLKGTFRCMDRNSSVRQISCCSLPTRVVSCMHTPHEVLVRKGGRLFSSCKRINRSIQWIVSTSLELYVEIWNLAPCYSIAIESIILRPE